jgi:hypothetical protein
MVLEYSSMYHGMSKKFLDEVVAEREINVVRSGEESSGEQPRDSYALRCVVLE